MSLESLAVNSGLIGVSNPESLYPKQEKQGVVSLVVSCKGIKSQFPHE